MPAGRQLIADIDSCRVAQEQCAFWWLGQLSYVVKLGDSVLYLDPFLTKLERRNHPPLLDPSDLINASAILGSHDHADHIDRISLPAIANATPAPIVVPALLRERLARDLRIPVERFIGLDHRTSSQIGDLTITGVAAAHECLDRDENTGQHPYLGFIVEGNGFTVYFSGDTCRYEGLETLLLEYKPDLVFLPINGRDAVRLRRNCIGNMTYQEAADLAGSLRPALTVPGHFDMFDGNMENPQLFVDYMNVKYPHLNVAIPALGKRVIVNVDPDRRRTAR